MLGTYFVLILAMFIVMVVGAVIGYTGSRLQSVCMFLSRGLGDHSEDSSAQGSRQV